MSREQFYNTIRQNLFGGALTQSQVDGIEALFLQQDKYKLIQTQFAYILATVFHETGARMQPVKERGGEGYLRTKAYYPYYGRDLVQTTWKGNYEKVKNYTGIDVVTNPDLIGELSLAAEVAFVFMIKGWYTGKKLCDYITTAKTDYKGARKIINGIDKAEQIRDYAQHFYRALIYVR